MTKTKEKAGRQASRSPSRAPAPQAAPTAAAPGGVAAAPHLNCRACGRDLDEEGLCWNEGPPRCVLYGQSGLPLP